MEARQEDQPCPIGEREQEADPAEGDSDGSGESFDVCGPLLASFRDPGEDCRDDAEEHDKDGGPSVDDVPQGTASQPDRRSINYDDRGCSGRSALENKAKNRREEH